MFAIVLLLMKTRFLGIETEYGITVNGVENVGRGCGIDRTRSLLH